MEHWGTSLRIVKNEPLPSCKATPLILTQMISEEKKKKANSQNNFQENLLWWNLLSTLRAALSQE